MAKADVTIEATYSLPVITHVCLETHGLTAKWEGDDKIVAWASTQAVRPTASELAGSVQDPGHERHGPDRGDGRRVRLEVRRRRLGHRPPPSSRRRPAAGRSRCSSTGPGAPRRGQSPQRHGATSSSGATKDGKLVAMIAETHGTGGSTRRLELPAALCLRRPRTRRGRTPTSSSTAATPGRCGPRAIPRAAP